jgi:hypothetical protein
MGQMYALEIVLYPVTLKIAHHIITDPIVLITATRPAKPVARGRGNVKSTDMSPS